MMENDDGNSEIESGNDKVPTEDTVHKNMVSIDMDTFFEKQQAFMQVFFKQSETVHTRSGESSRLGINGGNKTKSRELSKKLGTSISDSDVPSGRGIKRPHESTKDGHASDEDDFVVHASDGDFDQDFDSYGQTR